MREFGWFGGVDFSGAREPLSNLWSAVGRESEGRLRIIDVRPHAYRADLAAFAMDGWYEFADPDASILWGVDFPLGLPVDIAAALGAGDAWKRQIRWIADRPPDEIRDAAGDAAKSSRVADAGAMAPFDIRLYKQTVEGIRWIHDFLEESSASVLPQAPDSAASSTFIEVYPSASVRDLGLPRRRSPGRPGEVRARLAALKPYLDFDDDRIASIVVTLEDAWDAVIACLTAYLCRDDLEQFERINPQQAPRIRAEGWIYRPPDAL